MTQQPIGIGFTGIPYNARQIANLAMKAEESHVSSFWIAEDYYLRDAVSLLSCAAFATSKIRLGAGILNPYTRNPVLLAQTIATLGELSNGRMDIAIGTGERSLIESMGIEFRFPIATMKESVKMIRTLLKGESLTHSGRVFSASNVRIGYNPYIDPPKDNFIPSSVKIYLAAIGPKMLDLAGEIADGVLLSAGLSTKKVSEARSIVIESAKRNGKKTNELEIAGYVLCCYGRASSRHRRFVADLVHIWPDNFRVDGIPDSAVASLSGAYERGGPTEAEKMVTEEMVEAVVACGTKKEIEGRLEEFRKAGLSLPILFPFETDIEPILDIIG